VLCRLGCVGSCLSTHRTHMRECPGSLEHTEQYREGGGWTQRQGRCGTSDIPDKFGVSETP